MLAQFECKRAGLGDIVLPGLLLCFSLRLDDAKASEGRAAVAVAGGGEGGNCENGVGGGGRGG